MEMTEIEEIKDILRDIVWLNALIATELVQITENTSRAIRDGDLPEDCKTAHNELREMAISILKKHAPVKAETLADHVLKH